MGSVAVGSQHHDRYFVLFPTTLVILSVSHRLSAFIYEVRITKRFSSPSFASNFVFNLGQTLPRRPDSVPPRGHGNGEKRFRN